MDYSAVGKHSYFQHRVVVSYLISLYFFRFGVRAGINEPPEYCKLLEGICEVIFVLREDPSKPCDPDDLPESRQPWKPNKIHTRRKNLTIT